MRCLCAHEQDIGKQHRLVQRTSRNQDEGPLVAGVPQLGEAADERRQQPEPDAKHHRQRTAGDVPGLVAGTLRTICS